MKFYYLLFMVVHSVWCQPDCQNPVTQGKDYTGTVDQTMSGIPCQKWSSQEPHTHKYDYVGNHSYCRNPTEWDDDDGVWCYTTDPKIRWELCNVPFCEEDICMTDKGACIFPFIYQRNTYKGCTKAWHSQAWCAIKTDQTGSWWGNCPSSCKTHISGLIDGTCYEDEGGRWYRLLPRRLASTQKNSPEECKIICTSHDYLYAGVQNAKECWCGNYEPHEARIRDSSQCNMNCTGDALQKCGGSRRINIYKTVQLPKNGNWHLLFRQTINGKDELFKKSEWTRNKQNVDAPNYSRLGDFEKFRRPDGSFHLFLSYPELGNGNEWTQTSNPVTKTSKGVDNYKAISIPYTGYHWGGLEHNNGPALLDGSVDHPWWFYAIGSTTLFNDGIPGPKDDKEHHVVKKVELYMDYQEPCGVENAPLGRISGGSDTAPNQYPWMVRTPTECGGALITDRHVLTARHCVGDTNNSLRGKMMKINVHTQYDPNDYQQVAIKEAVWPRGASWNRKDFAIIILEKAVDLSDINIGTVCLPASKDKVYRGSSATAMGWGMTAVSSPQHPVLKHVNLKVSHYQNLMYVRYLWTDVPVVNGVPQDPCAGDSGSPLVHRDAESGRWTIIGTVSGGGYNCRTGKMNGKGMWNRVTAYLAWIQQVIGKDSWERNVE